MLLFMGISMEQIKRKINMLRIEIVNDGTANKIPENIAKLPDGSKFCIFGNYNYKIYINYKLVGSGRLEDFNRMTGWKGLVRYLGDTVYGRKED